MSKNKILELSAIILIFTGTLFLASGLIISKDEAIKLGKFYPTLGQTNDFEKWKVIPPVADRWGQSKSAKTGIIFISIGTLLQIINIISKKKE